MDYFIINKTDWNNNLGNLVGKYNIFIPSINEFSQDYEIFSPSIVPSIVYNKPKPATPLKSFFLPVRENVTSDRYEEKPRIIIGVPNCDVEALGLLDEIYLDESFEDKFYRSRRENTIIIGTDCFDTEEHCHCMSYDVKPWSESKADLALVEKTDHIILRVISGKGRSFLEKIGASPVTDKSTVSFIETRHRETVELLLRTNKGLPGYSETGALISDSGPGIWNRYSAKCVSCGACTTICPTCTCFLLIDKPGFHKVKQMDACQYPGFERVAGGEDGLKDLSNRFRNRYFCKYVWKPSKFKSIACTGCGRCIEACIGKINKNVIFREMAI